MTAVTFALPVESSDFVKLLQNATARSRDGVESLHGEINGNSVAVMHTGVGGRACEESIARFLKRQKVDYLISAGFAGALDPELKFGDLLIAENFSSRELLEAPELRLEEASIYLAPIVTAPKVVESETERVALATSSGAAAVDMETEFIAKACAEHNVPMLSLRTISDTVAEPLPAPANILFDVGKQKTPAGRLAFYIATHPAAIGRLKAFGEKIKTARSGLTTALASLLRTKLI